MPPGQGDQCPFCQLIANPEQLKVVGETENFYAWLDINPRAKGYTMIVPKEHMGSITEFSPGEYQEAMRLVRKVVDKAKEGLGADGVSVTMNIDEAGGQMVPHAYIQVFPRFEDEETSGTPTGAIFQPHEEAKKNLDSIKEKMASVDSSFGETTKEAHPDSQNFKNKGGNSEQSSNDKKPKSKSSEPLSMGGPLSGGIGAGSKTSSSTSGEQSKQKSPSQESSDNKNKESDSDSDEKEEVRLDGEFEAKSFEWK